MQEKIEAFFDEWDFGDAWEDHELNFQHFDDASQSILFLVADEESIEEVRPAVKEAMKALVEAHPECDAVSYEIEAG